MEQNGIDPDGRDKAVFYAIYLLVITIKLLKVILKNRQILVGKT